jgi:hypothetical protein
MKALFANKAKAIWPMIDRFLAHKRQKTPPSPAAQEGKPMKTGSIVCYSNRWR